MLSNLCILPQLNNNTALFPPDLQAHPSLDLSVTASGLVIARLHLHSIIKYIWKAMIPKFMFLAPDFTVSARPILKYLLVSSLGCKVGESTWTLWISLALIPPKKSPKPENKTKILQGFASLLKPEAQVYFSFFCLAHLPYPCSSPPSALYWICPLFSSGLSLALPMGRGDGQTDGWRWQLLHYLHCSVPPAVCLAPPRGLLCPPQSSGRPPSHPVTFIFNTEFVTKGILFIHLSLLFENLVSVAAGVLSFGLLPYPHYSE